MKPLALLLVASLLGCGSPPPAPPPMQPLGARAIRLHDGVPLAHFGPDRAPVVRVDGEPGAWALAVGGVELPTAVARDGAHVFLVAAAPPAGAAPVPEGPLRLEVTDDGRPLAGWTVWWGPPPTGGATAAMEAVARRLGRMGLPRGEVAGWRALAAVNRWLDRPTEAARALRIAAIRAFNGGAIGEARALLDASAPLDAAVGDVAGAANAAYVRAGVDMMVGELRAAKAGAAEVVRLARAARLPALVLYGTVLDATVDSQVGRHADARATLDRLASSVADVGPDLRLIIAGNRGWVLMEGHRRGAFEADPDDIRAAFEAALEAAEGRPDEQANQHANLAALARLVGDRAALDRHVAAHDRLDPGRRGLPGLFVDLLDGHRALLDGDGAAARSRFDAVERRLGERVDDPVGAYLWQARLGRARASRLAGDGPGALAAYRAALAVVERAAARTGLQEQRALFFAEQAELFDEAFEAALAEGDLRAAFAVADGARARVVRGLEVRTRLARLDDGQRATWGRLVGRYVALRAAYEQGRADGELMAADRRVRWAEARRRERAALQAAFDAAHDWLDRVAPVSPGGADVAAVQGRLGPDEGLWLAHPVRGRWHGFLVTPGAFEHRVGGPVPEVVPSSVRHLALVGVPPAAAPALWGSASTAVWTHAGALRAAPAVSGPRVVVGDPDQSLPGARHEAEVVAGLIGGERLVGAAVDRAAMRAALTTASAVHFAGHGVLVPASPWDAHLRLAGDERLTTEDVLLAPVRPRLVVLSSCETGGEAPLADRIALSLADALVAAGAGSVVAAERPVPDAAALAMMRRFYAEGGLERPAEALRRAALAARADGDAQWDAFHLRGAR